jgi:hypothetical protein
MNIRDDLAPIKSCVLFFSFATTTWEYDALGRQAKETRADGTTTTTNYEWWKTDANQSDAGIVYKVTTTTSGSSPKVTVVRPFGPVKVKTLPVLVSKVLVSEYPRALLVLTGNLPSVEYSTVVLLLSGSSPKVTYFDAFNRKTKEQHTGFDGRKIISDIHYDDLGRVKQASLPYFEDAQVVVRPFGPVKVKTLPVLVSKVLVSEYPRALLVLTGNLPSKHLQ